MTLAKINEDLLTFYIANMGVGSVLFLVLIVSPTHTRKRETARWCAKSSAEKGNYSITVPFPPLCNTFLLHLHI